MNLDIDLSNEDPHSEDPHNEGRMGAGSVNHSDYHINFYLAGTDHHSGHYSAHRNNMVECIYPRDVLPIDFDHVTGSVTDASPIVGIPVAAIVDSAEELIGAQDTFAIDD